MTDLVEPTATPRRPAPRLRFGDYVRAARREMRLSQELFAARLGVRTATVSAWESGRNTPDDLPAVATDLERVTGYSRQWFLGWGDVHPLPIDPSDRPPAVSVRTGCSSRRWFRIGNHEVSRRLRVAA